MYIPELFIPKQNRMEMRLVNNVDANVDLLNMLNMYTICVHYMSTRCI